MISRYLRKGYLSGTEPKYVPPEKADPTEDQYGERSSKPKTDGSPLARLRKTWADIKQKVRNGFQAPRFGRLNFKGVGGGMMRPRPK